MALTSETKIEVIQHIGVLRTYRNGATLEVNIVKQGSYPEKWDIRRWHLDENGTKCPGRGVFLDGGEIEELKALLDEQL